MSISVDFTAIANSHNLFKLRLRDSSVAIEYSIDHI